MSRNLNALAAGGLLAVGVLSGCTSGEQPQPDQTTATTTVEAPATRQEATPAVDPVKAYLTSPDRIARFQTSVQKFGMIILSQPAAWGGFDTYCTPANSTTDEGGYTSQGYHPKPGEVCSTQHTPAYRGPDIQVDATYLYGSEQFTGVSVNTPACHDVEVQYVPGANEWVASYFEGDAATSPTHDSVSARTVEEAQAVDNFALKCVDGTRP